MIVRNNESTDTRMFKVNDFDNFQLTREEIENVMFMPNKENANVPHGPEATNMTFGEMVKSDYACRHIFSPDVVAAHRDGSIHIHDLGMVDRVYSYHPDEIVMPIIGGKTMLMPISEVVDKFGHTQGLEIANGPDVQKTTVTAYQKHSVGDEKRMMFIKYSNGASQLVTHDHPVIVTDGTKTMMLDAKDVREGDQVLSSEQKLTFTGEFQDTELAYLMGQFIADGNYEENTLVFTISANGTERIVDFAESRGLSYTKRRRAGCYHVRLYSKFLTDMFHDMGIRGGASKKTLPFNVTTFTPDAASALVCGILDCDGTVNNRWRTRIDIRVTSRALVNQLHMVLDALDINARTLYIGYYDNKLGFKMNYPLYGISFGIPEGSPFNIGHSFKLTKDFKPSANKYISEDIFKVVNIKELSVEDVTRRGQKDMIVYDMTTKQHTFNCNGIYSHNCGGQSLEYVKKYGLSLPNSISIAKPAKHPEVLIAQMIKFSAALQGHFAGAIGWDAVNVFLSPYLVGKSDKELKQLAQILVYEFAQQAVSRGGQSIFSDLNLYWETPDHFENTPAIGPGGIYTGHTYHHYEADSQRFANALVDVYMEGDGAGRPFFFPKPEFHITEKFFKTDGHEDFLYRLSKLASVRGTPYFVFDRGDTAKVSQCCRLSFKLKSDDIEDAMRPETMRFSALQNVSLNLPRVAFLANGNQQKFEEILRGYMVLAVKAHIQKKNFINKLLDMGRSSPLALLNMDNDGTPYFRREKASFLIGMVGMNEAVKIMTGQEMHESKEAVRFGLKTTAQMHKWAAELSAEYNINLPLEQSPAESTAYRFARLDKAKFDSMQLPYKMPYNGDVESGDIYYTNSTYLNVGANVDPITRVKTEGMFHPLIEAGALSHVWLGESMPDASSISNFVTKTFSNTQNAQIAFSPEFTSCNKCHQTTRGLSDICLKCGSTNVDNITRVTGFFSKVGGWNPGKRAELKDRHRVTL